jgi:hypothetical protein
MFRKAYIKFNYLKKKYYFSDLHNVSAHYLFELCLDRNYKLKKNFKIFFFHLLLILVTIASIIIAKIRGINKINYFIAYQSATDPRSIWALKELNLKKYIHVVRVNSLAVALKVLFKYKIVIFHQSISYFSHFFIPNKYSTLKKKYNMFYKFSLYKLSIYEKIFKFLKIKKFVSIDDYRELQIFLYICKKYNIFSIGYMHSWFCQYRVALQYNYFDRYIVWSDYFAKQLILLNNNYKNRIILKNFKQQKFRKNKFNLNNKENSIIFFSDMCLDFEEVKTYLDYIINYTKFKLYVKIKVNEDVKLNFLKYLNSKNIKIFKNESLKELFLKVNPSIFIATNSSVLLESTIYNCLPFMIKTKNDFSEQFYKDKIVIKITSVQQLETGFKLLPNKDQVIKKIRNKIWIKQSNAYLNYNSKIFI